MSAFLTTLRHGSQAASFFLGGLVLLAVAASFLWDANAARAAGWAFDVLGTGFVSLISVLVFVAAFSLVRIGSSDATTAQSALWLEVGVQAAGGVATLALTFTLLGISLGIGGLAGQPLTPETVQPIIRDLTANFSLAFMTTVVGLPLSAALRAALLIANEKRLSERTSL